MSMHDPGSRVVAEAFSASGRKRKRRKAEAKVSERGQGKQWLLWFWSKPKYLPC
jgi:hypothetical protein